jgi:hypothetical protein
MNTSSPTYNFMIPHRRSILLHGFNVRDGGEGTIDMLKPGLEEKGYTPIELDYGWMGLIGTYFRNDNIARRLIYEYQPGDVIIGHSNGCAIIAMAIELGLPAQHCIFIHPALDNDWAPPFDKPVERIDVYFSAKDIPTRLAKWVPFNDWGDMGTVGPTTFYPFWKRHNDGLRHSEGFVIDPEMYLSSL